MRDCSYIYIVDCDCVTCREATHNGPYVKGVLAANRFDHVHQPSVLTKTLAMWTEKETELLSHVLFVGPTALVEGAWFAVAVATDLVDVPGAGGAEDITKKLY